MSIARKNPEVSEGIDILNAHFVSHNGDPVKAWATLSDDQNQFINNELIRCLSDPRYYLENYHVVKTEDRGLATLYPFWDSQEIFYNTIQNERVKEKPVKIVCLKARQQGISTVSQGVIFHKTIFTEACNTLIVAQDTKQADYLFSMSRLAYDNLPWWMRPEERYQAKGLYLVLDRRDDIERSFHPGLKSEIFVAAANKLSGVAVGQTIRTAHLSELSSWNNAKVLTTQIFPTMNARDGLLILESTARGRVGFWYDFWQKVESGKLEDWTSVFIEFYRVGKYSRPIPEGMNFKITSEEEGMRARILKEKGFLITDEIFNWKREKIKEFQSFDDEDNFYGEYPSTDVEAFTSTGLCAFPKKKLQSISERDVCNPIWCGEIYYDPTKEAKQAIKRIGEDTKNMDDIPPAEQEGARLRVWEWPEDGETYYVGVDVSHGVEGGDYSVCQVLKIGHGMDPDVQVAEWHGYINPTPLAYVAAGLGKLYNGAQLAVECNDVGLTTNNELFRVIEYDNMFRWKHYDKIRNFMTDFFGWYTNSKTRDAIISKMREAVMEGSIILRSEELLEEMFDFASDDGGRFEGQNTNDDLVMALLICYFCAHDSDYGKAASCAPRPENNHTSPICYVLNEKKRLAFQTRDEKEAKYACDAHPGWTFVRDVSRKDYFNSDFSPVHDRSGIRSDMFYQHGIPAEHIASDNMFSVPKQDSDDWRDF